MYFLYGIPNCDTVKKARDFLMLKKISYEFVDFKKTPPTTAQIELWEKSFGTLPVNKQGLTFKKHKEAFEKLSRAKQIEFIINNPSMIKRPILQNQDQVLAFGFDLNEYKKRLGV